MPRKRKNHDRKPQPDPLMTGDPVRYTLTSAGVGFTNETVDLLYQTGFPAAAANALVDLLRTDYSAVSMEDMLQDFREKFE